MQNILKIIIFTLITSATAACAQSATAAGEKGHHRFHSGIFLEASAKVNLRTDPTTAADVIRRLEKREVAVVVYPSPRHQFFVRVVTHDGHVGWVHKDYIVLWDEQLKEKGYLAQTTF